jgi:hypothetical protein
MEADGVKLHDQAMSGPVGVDGEAFDHCVHGGEGQACGSDQVEEVALQAGAEVRWLVVLLGNERTELLESVTSRATGDEGKGLSVVVVAVADRRLERFTNAVRSDDVAQVEHGAHRRGDRDALVEGGVGWVEVSMVKRRGRPARIRR